MSGWKHVGVVEGGGKSPLANCRFGISLCCVICLTVEGGMYRRLLIVGFVQRQELEDAVGRGWAGLRRLLLTASQTAMCCSGGIPPVGKVWSHTRSQARASCRGIQPDQVLAPSGLAIGAQSRALGEQSMREALSFLTQVELSQVELSIFLSKLIICFFK